MVYKEEDLILCIVERIENDVVLVKTLKDNVKGTITFPEVAPGRIKNIREYVVPNKIIVCKVLGIFPDHLNLSLRRVTTKEKNEILEKYKKEKDYENALKSFCKENAAEILEKIKKDFSSLTEFFQKIEENSKILDKYIPKELQESFKKIAARKKKIAEIKRIINLICLDDNGIEKIKEILNINKDNISMKYIAAGRYLLSITSEDFKKAEAILREIEKELEKRAKKEDCVFSISEK
ncbi:MAG: hypothetical protein QW103_00935 [Candidatus Pacearchaeota archaeon]